MYFQFASLCATLWGRTCLTACQERGAGKTNTSPTCSKSVLVLRRWFPLTIHFWINIKSFASKGQCFLYSCGQGWKKLLGFALSDIILYQLIIVVHPLVLNIDASFKEFANQFWRQATNKCEVKLWYESDKMLHKKAQKCHKWNMTFHKYLPTIGKIGRGCSHHWNHMVLYGLDCTSPAHEFIFWSLNA